MPEQSSRRTPQPGNRAPGDPSEKSPASGEQPSQPQQAGAPGDQPHDAPKPPETVTLTIDGRRVTVPKGTLVVEAAKHLGIEIPVFCYHHKMDPVGACRLCLVEMKPGPPKPQTACTTPAADGMEIQTMSPLAVSARADILEYELVNHPLDCPICDKGGECPLQDYTFRHAFPTSRVDDPKLHFLKPVPLSDFIALDRERCVLCYRCTRYYDEIAWEQELTTDDRGAGSFITSQFDQPLQSIFSGNIVDLCPVGALTSRVWRFESRPWDMHSTAGVCSKCSVGCNVNYWGRRGQLVRVTSRENDEIDDGWICDRGRFDYTYVNDESRLRLPEIDGARATWEQALPRAAELLRGKGGRLGIAIPQDITNEEAFLLTRLLAGPWRGARVVMENRTTLPAPAADGLRIAELDSMRAIVVVASDTREDVPIVNLRIKKAARKRGAKLLVVHPSRVDLDRDAATAHFAHEPGNAAQAVRDLIGHELLREGPVAVLYGDGHGSENATELAEAVNQLAQASGGKVMALYRGTNERGALAMGLATTAQSLDGVETLFCWGMPPGQVVSGNGHGPTLPTSIREVVAFDIFRRPEHGSPAVLLPSVSFAETGGSYMNVDGHVQFIEATLRIQPPLRERWEVLTELGELMGAQMPYVGIHDIQRAAAEQFPALAQLASPPKPSRSAVPLVYGPSRP